MEIYERIKLLRKDVLHLTQEGFASKIKISRANLGSIEVGRISVTDRVISDICSAFNLNEKWLKNGVGKIYKESDFFSLDEYAKQKMLSPLELEIIKNFMEFSCEERSQLLSLLKKLFSQENSSNEVAEVSSPASKYHELTAADQAEIDAECEDYRRELEAEAFPERFPADRDNSQKKA